MKVLPCPFCGHNRISIHKIKMDLVDFVITRCEFCAASKSIPATANEEVDKNNVVIEWNKREYYEEKAIDIQMKKLAVREKQLELKQKSANLKNIGRNEIVTSVAAVQKLIESRSVKTEMNMSNTDTIIVIEPMFSDLDTTLLKDKLNHLLNQL